MYDFMSGIKYLNFIADVFKVPADERMEKIHKYADLFELTDDLAQPISSYSLRSYRPGCMIRSL